MDWALYQSEEQELFLSIVCEGGFAMPGLGIFAWFSYPLPISERLARIRRAGFDAVSLWWGGEEKEKAEQPGMARRLGLDIDHIPAPIDGCGELWLDNLNGEDYLKTLLACIDDCQTHQIPTVVVHVARLSVQSPLTILGLERVKRLTERAEKQNVRLALENTNCIPHLDRIFEEIPSEHLGFCYDTGHERLLCPSVDCLTRYGHRLFAVHLSDNFGDGDTHLLPRDGDTDWAGVKEKLLKAKPLRYWTAEVDFDRADPRSRAYGALSADQFLSAARERLSQLL